MLTKYLNVIKVSFQHKDFGDKDIEEFEYWVDEWFYLYISWIARNNKLYASAWCWPPFTTISRHGAAYIATSSRDRK
jgi:hypothetical protein